VLTSPFFPSLAETPVEDEYSHPVLLAERLELAADTSGAFLSELNEALERLVREREADGFRQPGDLHARRTHLDDTEPPGEDVPCPAFTVQGAARFRDIRDLEALKGETAPDIRWLPSRARAWCTSFPRRLGAAQGWGTERRFSRSLSRSVLCPPGRRRPDGLW
jgi:hypothetical protein